MAAPAQTSGSLGHTRLLAYLTDSESIKATRAYLKQQGITDASVENGNAGDAAEYLKNHASPEVLLVEVPSAKEAPPLLDALADVVNPVTKVIVTGKVDTLSFYQWLMGLGIHEYLLEPFTDAQLKAALDKGVSKPVAKAEEKPTQKRLIAVIGARGGVGATTVATTIAAILAKEMKLPTGLIDLDPHFGSVALSLDLEPGRGLRDALEKPDRIDGLFLERVTIKPFPNLAILSAEEQLAETIGAQPNSGEVLFHALKEKFPLLVVDLPRQVSPLTRHVLQIADHVLIVVEPTLLCLRDALRIKDLLVDTLKRPTPMLISNQEGLNVKNELPKKDFTKHFGAEAAAHVPFLPEAASSMTKGETLLANAKLAASLGSLRDLAHKISGEQAPVDTAKGAEKKKPEAKSKLGFLAKKG